MDLDKKKAEAVIEAVLFAMGESVEISKLAHALEMDNKEIKKIVSGMNERYKAEDRGISIVELEDSYQQWQ